MSIKGFSVSGVTDRYDYNYLDNKPEIHSIPTGGTAGQVLAKRSGADYAVEWADQTGGGGDITVDDVLSNTSENPVQNKVITAALATKADQAGIQQVIEDEVDDWLSVQAPSIGTLSYAAKQALLACFRKVAWIDDQGQSYYNALESELFPDATLESITAVFTQGSATIYETDSLDTLKQYLTVTATYADSTSATVTDYELSGTLTAGASTITASYNGKTATFTVNVTGVVWLYKDGDECTSLTGGWDLGSGFVANPTKFAVSKDSNMLSIEITTSGGTNAQSISTHNAIDLTNYSTLVMEGTLKTDGGGVSNPVVYFPTTLNTATSQSGAYGSDYAQHRAPYGTGVMDISGQSGNRYISINFNVWSGAPVGNYIRVTRAYLK